MSHHQSNSPARNLSSRRLGFLAASLLALSLYSGCGSQQTGEGNKASGPVPAPYQKRDLSDTPIVVSGGSVHLHFNSSIFQLCTPANSCGTPVTPGDKQYWAPGTISSAYYYNDNENGPDDAYPISAGADSIVTIECSGGGNTGNIVITSDSGRNRIVLEVSEEKFKPRRAGSPRLTNKKFKIDHLRVSGSATDYPTHPTWPNGNKVTVEFLRSY